MRREGNAVAVSLASDGEWQVQRAKPAAGTVRGGARRGEVMVWWRITASCICWGEDTVKRTLSSAPAHASTVELVQCVELLYTNGNGCDLTGVSQ
eukprot:2835829-Pleurochrysis_carterae.AAC.1